MQRNSANTNCVYDAKRFSVRNARFLASCFLRRFLCMHAVLCMFTKICCMHKMYPSNLWHTHTHWERENGTLFSIGMRINWRKYETLFWKLKYLQKYASRVAHNFLFLPISAFTVVSFTLLRYTYSVNIVGTIWCTCWCFRQIANEKTQISQKGENNTHRDTQSAHRFNFIFHFFSFIFGVLSGFGCAVENSKLKRNDTSSVIINLGILNDTLNTLYSCASRASTQFWKVSQPLAIWLPLCDAVAVGYCHCAQISNIHQMIMWPKPTRCSRINTHQSVVDLRHRSHQFICTCNKRHTILK